MTSSVDTPPVSPKKMRDFFKELKEETDCDIVARFNRTVDDDTVHRLSEEISGQHKGLRVVLRRYGALECFAYHITASEESLAAAAEELNFYKEVKPELGGGMREFVRMQHDDFKLVPGSNSIFTRAERQMLTNQMLNNIRATEARTFEKVKFVDGQALIPRLVSKGVIRAVFPLHSITELEYLKKSWAGDFLHKQPLEKVCDYYGTKIAMYFAWLGHYTLSLILPALLGIGVYLFRVEEESTSDMVHIFFCVCILIWATVFLETWKRRSCALSYRWGTLESSQARFADPRPQFHGPLTVCPITGKWEPNYPSYKRNLVFYGLSVPAIFLCLLIVLYTMLAIIDLQDWFGDRFASGDVFTRQLRLVPVIFMTIMIALYNTGYSKLALWLNDLENYRTQTEYDNQLISKLILFKFVNNYLLVFYTAFYLRDMTRLREQLTALLVIRPISGNIQEVLIPYFTASYYRVNLKNIVESYAPNKLQEVCVNVGKKWEDSPVRKRFFSKAAIFTSEEWTGGQIPTIDGQGELESRLPAYEDTFEDYLEMFIQFGYVTMFSSTYPLAPFWALFNNLFEIRTDAFKLCSSMRRPFAQRVASIGIWQTAMELMGYLAVVVNCTLIMTGGHAKRVIGDVTELEVVTTIIILEHVIVAAKVYLHYAIPDTPRKIDAELHRLDYNRRMAHREINCAEAAKRCGQQPTEDPTLLEAEESSIRHRSGHVGIVLNSNDSTTSSS